MLYCFVMTLITSDNIFKPSTMNTTDSGAQSMNIRPACCVVALSWTSQLSNNALGMISSNGLVLLGGVLTVSNVVCLIYTCK